MASAAAAAAGLGLLYVAFADIDEQADAMLSRPGAANIPSYARLFAKRPKYKFIVLPASDVEYDRLPDTPIRGVTVVLRWHRNNRQHAPRTTMFSETTFPWPVDGPMTLFRADTHELAAHCTVRWFSGTGREAAGIVSVDLVDLPREADDAYVANDFARAIGTQNFFTCRS